jgi:hypothetical protein
MPSRLTMRLATLVAMISRRRRCCSIASPNLSCIGSERRAAARRPGGVVGDLGFSIARLEHILRGGQEHRPSSG